MGCGVTAFKEGRTFAKHGVLCKGDKPEVSLVFWTGVFLSPGRRIRVIGKETGPGPGGYGKLIQLLGEWGSVGGW